MSGTGGPHTSPLDQPTPRERASWRGRQHVQVALLALVVIALLAVLGQRLYVAQQAAGLNLTRVARAGSHASARKVAPDFTLHSWAWEQSHGTGVDPQRVSLRALRGNPVVINFWASWCDACQAEAPVMERAWRTYQARGVVFLGIDVNDTATDSATFLKRYGITYYNAPDATGRIFIQYGVIGLPTTVFVNRNGDIASTHIGEISASALDASIQSLLR